MFATQLVRVASRYPILRQKAHLSTAATRLIVNAVGQDRVGIVSDVAGLVIKVGGNVGDSQAATLGSHFSLMMIVDVPSDRRDDLTATLHDLPDMNIAVFETKQTEPTFTPQIAYSGYFTLEGADNPGIVHTLTSAIAKHGLNIEKLETDQDIAPYGGTLLFRMRGVVNAFEPLAKSFDIAKIKQDLADLGDSLNCEVALEDHVDDSTSSVFYGG